MVLSRGTAVKVKVISWVLDSLRLNSFVAKHLFVLLNRDIAAINAISGILPLE